MHLNYAANRIESAFAHLIIIFILIMYFNILIYDARTKFATHKLKWSETSALGGIVGIYWI